MNDAQGLRPLGRSGLVTRPLALGGNVFGWSADETASHAVLDRFVDAGFSLIDTADVYSKWVPGHVGGESETIIGRWLKSSGKRDRVLVATKVGGEMAAGEKGLSARHIAQAAEASLRRLQTDYIDLYQAHFSDDEVTFEETLGAFDKLITQGKVRAIGVSNHDPARLRAALEASGRSGLPRYETLQPLYNLYDRAEFEADFAPFALEHGIGCIPFKALANGFLSGKYRSEADLEGSRRKGALKGYFSERGLRILAALDVVAGRVGATAAQVGVAWVIAQPGVTAPIAGANTVEQLNDQIAATRLSLDHESLVLLNEASAP